MGQTSSSSPHKRIWGIDAAKAIGAIMVVIDHSSVLNPGTFHNGVYTPSVSILFWLICVFSVPLFFMISGALGLNRPASASKVLEKMLRLVFVASFWTIALDLLINLILGRPIVLLPRILDHYWFIYALAGLYGCNYVLSRWNPVCRKVVTAVLLLFPFMSNFVWLLIVYFDPSVAMPQWGRTGLFVSYSLVYYHIGYLLVTKRLNKFMALGLFLAGWALQIFDTTTMTNYYQHFYDISNSLPMFGPLLMTCGLLALLMHLECKVKWLAWIVSIVGRNSLGIYIFQFFIIDIINAFVRRPQLLPSGLDFLIPVTVTILSVAISELIKHSPLRVTLKL